jgi:hypothetical protein
MHPELSTYLVGKFVECLDIIGAVSNIIGFSLLIT